MATTNLYNLINLFKASDASEEKFIPLTKIEIPIIQRDYAQGRNEYDINRIRNRFLEALYNALTEAKQLKLDFVYGDINDKRVLTPLDGQQRLTTLFLLHWYIGRHEGIDNNELEFLKKFSYSTRYSARTFCEHLVEHVPNFSLDSISEDIIDQSWMPLDWKNDPTINAMLNMLDSIHQKFKDTSGLWHLLEEGCISFYFLSIKDMGLSDELYIKMNSRGKPLTQFEHFKAEWERYIKLIDSDKRISRKIDIDWTDILWPYKDKDNTIDDKFVRYYKYLCSIIYYKKYPNEEIPQDIFDLTKELFFEKRDDVSDNLLFIEEGFDCLKLKDIKPKDCFEKFLTKKQHAIGQSHIDEEIDVFEDCCKNFGEYKSSGARSFSIGRMLLLYSFILYWKNKDKIDEDQFARRLRIVNNLIKASEDELRAERMNNLLEQTEEIIVKGEIKNEDNKNTFNSMQLQEEVEKNEWLLTHPDAEPQLYYLEDHPLLYGSISVVGIENLGYADRFYSLFNCDKGRVNQALLTIGDYSLKTRDRYRYQIGTKGFDATWKSIFHKNRDNVKNVNNILVELLGKYETFTDDILDQIINSYIESAREYDWRYYLVKYESMRPEKYGMYYWHNDSDKKSYDILMMYTEKSIGGRNSNIFLKTLFNKFKSEYPDKTVRLGDYAYQKDGNVIELQCVGKKAYYKDAEFIIEDVENTDDKQTISIKQNQGVDIQDRVEIAWIAIKQLIK